MVLPLNIYCITIVVFGSLISGVKWNLLYNETCDERPLHRTTESGLIWQVVFYQRYKLWKCSAMSWQKWSFIRGWSHHSDLSLQTSLYIILLTSSLQAINMLALWDKTFVADAMIYKDFIYHISEVNQKPFIFILRNNFFNNFIWIALAILHRETTTLLNDVNLW